MAAADIFAINVPFVAVTLALITVASGSAPRSAAPSRVDGLGVLLTFLGLAGPLLALVDQRNPGASPARPAPGACDARGLPPVGSMPGRPDACDHGPEGTLDGISQCQQSVRYSDANLNYKRLISYSTTFTSMAVAWQ